MICQSAVHPLSGSIPILRINLFLSFIALSLAFSSGAISLGTDALLEFGEAFFGKSLMCPTLDSTI